MTAFAGINLLSIAPESSLTDVANIHAVHIGRFHLVDFSLKYALHNSNLGRDACCSTHAYLRMLHLCNSFG